MNLGVKNIFQGNLLFAVILLGGASLAAQNFSGQSVKLGEIKIEKAGGGKKSAVKKWREDLKYIATELPGKHKNLFHRLDREIFYREVKKLDAKIPTLTRNQAALEFGRIVGLARDGHTSLFPVFNPQMKFNMFPIEMYAFLDGTYIRRADPELKHLLGAKLLRIGRMSIEEASKTVMPYVAGDNEMFSKAIIPTYLASPEVLFALGISARPDRVWLEVEVGGRILKKELKLSANRDNSVRSVFRSRNKWLDIRSESKKPTPLTLKRRNERFWFEHIESEKLIFVQLNELLNGQKKTIEQFFGEVFAVAKSNNVEKFVLDLRYNGGGNNGLVRPIIRGLIQLEKIDRKGNLFVIIGRRTFSAAQNLVNQLETWTNVVFVGEPTGSHVNMYGDARTFRLPNSGLRLRISELWHQDKNERDTRKWTLPQIAAEPEFVKYKDNIDPAMEAILKYKHQKSITKITLETYKTGSLKSLRKEVIAFKNDPANKYRRVRSQINRFGYRLIGMKDLRAAIYVFELNVELYPNSSNAYDSLAEAYALAGKKELAIQYYKKSLALNPNNSNADRQISKLRKEGKQKNDE